MSAVKQLHRAAARRAYRTFAQGLGGSAVVTALVAVTTDGREAVTAVVIAVGTTVATAFGSFWQAVAAGLPEAPKPPPEGPARHVAPE